MNDWLRVTAIGGDDYECRMTVLKADDTTITVTRPWHHHWTDGWDWKTIIRQWLSDVPETFEPYDGLVEWLRDADTERIDCWHCLSWLANHRRSAVASLSDVEKEAACVQIGFRTDCRGETTMTDRVRISALRKTDDHQARIAILSGGGGVEVYDIWLERPVPDNLDIRTLIHLIEQGVDGLPDDIIDWLVKDGLPDAGTYRCTITDSKDDSTVRDVRLVVTADNKVGLYDADGKALK